MNRLLTGIQPSGRLHLGSYLGSIKQIVELQDKYETLVMIADLHALTVPQDPKTYADVILDVASTLIASGLDTNKTVLFTQSAVSAHTKLAWIFSCLTPLGELERMTQFKEKADRHGQNAGLLTYPVLQAADVLLYQPEVVPVGEDQAQHLELTRTVARKFNARFGKYFTEPKTLLTSAARVMAFNDPAKKMSKSIAGSAVNIDDNEETIRKIVMSAVTDTNPSDKMSPGVANLFGILEELDHGKTESFIKDYENKTLKYVDLKTTVADAIVKIFTPIAKRKKELLENKDELVNILKSGNAKASEIAEKTMGKVEEMVGLRSI